MKAGGERNLLSFCKKKVAKKTVDFLREAQKIAILFATFSFKEKVGLLAKKGASCEEAPERSKIRSALRMSGRRRERSQEA
jgi:hypothetical protein